MKKFLAILLIISSVTIVILNLKTNYLKNFKKQQNTTINIVTTFYPIAEFTKNIAGDKATITNLVPAGTEPHTFEPSSQDIATLIGSDIFVYNGAGFEHWLDKIQTDLNANHVQIVNSSKGVDYIYSNSSTIDPHFWLDPPSAIIQVQNIKNALIQKDPDNKDYYESNAQKFIGDLKQLDQDYRKALNSCERRDVITSHNAFTYIAKRYNFNSVSISGLSPDEEPSPQKLSEISGFAKTNNIKYIFFESLVSPKLSDTIAKEVGAKTLVFNPIEGLTQEQIDQGQNYITIQNQNLSNLKLALNCQ